MVGSTCLHTKYEPSLALIKNERKLIYVKFKNTPEYHPRTSPESLKMQCESQRALEVWCYFWTFIHRNWLNSCFQRRKMLFFEYCVSCKRPLTFSLKTVWLPKCQTIPSWPEILSGMITCLCATIPKGSRCFWETSWFVLRYHCMWLMDESTISVVTFLWAHLLIYEIVRMLSFLVV